MSAVPDPDRRSPGFSLVEVVVALAILLILLPLSAPIYEAFLKDAREEALRQRLTQMRRAIRLFYQDQGRFPNLLFDRFGNQVDFLDSSLSELCQGVHNGAGGSYPSNRRRYLAMIPVDPFTERPDWTLVRGDTAPVGPASRRPMETATGTRQLSAAKRGITSGTIQILDNIQQISGMVTVMNVRSHAAGYEEY